ncbi:MAG: PqqD family protein [Phycisphaerae bacterium]
MKPPVDTAEPEGLLPRLRAGVHLHRLADELILFDPRTNTTHRLNATAADIWRCCAGAASGDEAAARLAAEYDVDVDTARRDVVRIAGQLFELDLLERPLFAA